MKFINHSIWRMFLSSKKSLTVALFGFWFILIWFKQNYFIHFNLHFLKSSLIRTINNWLFSFNFSYLLWSNSPWTTSPVRYEKRRWVTTVWGVPFRSTPTYWGQGKSGMRMPWKERGGCFLLFVCLIFSFNSSTTVNNSLLADLTGLMMGEICHGGFKWHDCK